MDIAALSTQMQISRLSDAVGIRLLSMANDQAETQGQQMIQLMQQSVQPYLGGNFDVKI
ncbi:YjfB family protein [Paenibacillus hamazuiensis]|uniref:YjfB family protein n=1 Tax=Paenibacillus hamazuiensis TaxID=2936508 RepID=UPI00200E667E|nr:YjfB family protein [Paenibacillus hamazuiensis]